MRTVWLPVLLLIWVGCTAEWAGNGVPPLPLSATITATRDSAGTRLVSVQLTNPNTVHAESDFCAGRIELMRDGTWRPLVTAWGDPRIVCTGEVEVLQPKSTRAVEYRVAGVIVGDHVRFVGQGVAVRPGSSYEPQPVVSGEYVVY